MTLSGEMTLVLNTIGVKIVMFKLWWIWSFSIVYNPPVALPYCGAHVLKTLIKTSICLTKISYYLLPFLYREIERAASSYLLFRQASVINPWEIGQLYGGINYRTLVTLWHFSAWSEGYHFMMLCLCRYHLPLFIDFLTSLCTLILRGSQT